MDRLTHTQSERRRFPEAWARDRWVERQASVLPPGSRVLDAGAGAAKYRPLFAHCHYETQDFCKYEGSLVKYVSPIDYVCEVTAIPLPDKCLDAIICTEVIEHVVNPVCALQEFARLLKPGGHLFLSAPLLSYIHMEPYHYYGGFTHYWYRYWLPRKGFQIVEISPVGGPARTAVTYLEAFIGQWELTEQTLSGLRFLISRVGRMFGGLILRVSRRLAPPFDRWLGGGTVCSGYLIAAQRQSADDSSVP